MEAKEILDALREICIRSQLDDLDPEYFPIIGNEEENRICMFFVMDGVLYHGVTVGNLDYYPIGKCEDVVRILYRLYEDDQTCEFCLEFKDFRLILIHELFCGTKPVLKCGEEPLKDEKKVWDFLEKKVNER